MPSLSDGLLRHGLDRIYDVHGEQIKILDGLDAGRMFIGRICFEADFDLVTDLGVDNRGKRIVRFIEGCAPRLGSGGQIQQSNGMKWKAVKNPHSDYLETDYELQEIIANKDTL